MPNIGNNCSRSGVPFRTAIAVLLWDARYSLLTVALAGFGRAVAEVGAVIIVGGNIKHVTRVMTTAHCAGNLEGRSGSCLGPWPDSHPDCAQRQCHGFPPAPERVQQSVCLVWSAGLEVRNNHGQERRAPQFPLSVRQLVYSAGEQRLIAGIDLTIEQGPRTVIMGPNGAGKSLLLRLLHGLLTPTAGVICWGAAQEVDLVRHRQALVFQRPVLLRRSVGANLRFVLKLRQYARAEREERLRHILELASLLASR